MLEDKNMPSVLQEIAPKKSKIGISVSSKDQLI